MHYEPEKSRPAFTLLLIFLRFSPPVYFWPPLAGEGTQNCATLGIQRLEVSASGLSIAGIKGATSARAGLGNLPRGFSKLLLSTALAGRTVPQLAPCSQPAPEHSMQVVASGNTRASYILQTSVLMVAEMELGDQGAR
jgi:hypothetical protein